MIGNKVIKHTKREWNEGRFNGGFLDYFNFTLGCNKKCPIHLIQPISCEMSDKRDNILIKFNSPHVNNTVHVLKADPFKMMARINENTTCSIKYDGPEKVIFSEKENCLYPINKQYTSSSDMVLIPRGNCKRDQFNSKSTSYYVHDYCKPRKEQDQENFIQIKHYGNANYIYCPESKIEVDGRTKNCPNLPFKLPLYYEFKINDLEYSVDKLYVEMKAQTDTVLSFRANREMKPSIKIQEILQEIKEAEELVKKSEEIQINDFIDGYSHFSIPLIILSSGLTVILIAIVLIFIYRKYIKRENIVQISARRVSDSNDDDDQAEEHEMDPLNTDQQS